MPVGLIAALPAEARAARPLEHEGWQVVVAGVGRDNAANAARALVDKGVLRLLVWGVAGALQPGLAPGDVIVPGQVLDEQGNRYPVCEQWRGQMLDCVAGINPLGNGALVTTAHPVADQQTKQTLARTTGAAAVDMEAAAVARVAQQHNVPFALVRAITDAFDQALPQAVSRARPGRHFATDVALRLAGRPKDWPGVVSLGRNMRAAKAGLAGAAAQLAAAADTADRG